MTKNKIAFLVPAHNEEKVISSTLESLLKITDKKHIYVVDDGSQDQTLEIAKLYTQNVLSLNPNQGKASAMNSLIKEFKLVKNYQYLMPMDADTQVEVGIQDAVLPIFEADKNKKIACIVGKVVGKNKNWITNFRIWEYEVAQTIHKAAQSKTNTIIVCPGCATIYRTEIFKKVQIPEGTLTEDMDLTFLIHRQNLGQIVYTSKFKVITQDPNTLTDFLKQIDRWYTGFWQCVLKHNIPWEGQKLDAEVALLAAEGLFNGVLVIILLFLIPKAIQINSQVLLFPLFLDLFLFMIPTLLYTLIRHKTWKIYLYIFHFYFLRLLTSLIFLKTFFKVVFYFDLKMGWNKAQRYQVN